MSAKLDRFADRLAGIVAARVVARLAELLDVNGTEPMIDAAEVARRLGVSRDYVYRHAHELGGVRRGDGTKAPLRFDPAKLPHD
jgi:hypothetical protein